MIIIITPPVVLPSEPPAGIARLSGILTAAAIPHRLWDANNEGLKFLLQLPQNHFDTWTSRAKRQQERHLTALKNYETYLSLPRYQRAVTDLNRILERATNEAGVKISLGNYQDDELSPLRSTDLCLAARSYDKNPFYPFFSRRLAEIIAEITPHYIGISLNYLSQAFSTFAMIGFIRENYPQIKIMLGGGLITSWIRNKKSLQPLGHLVDHFIAGSGVGELTQLLGITSGNKSSCTPNYSDLPLGEYLSPGFILPYSASSGCSWRRCTFCPERSEGNPYISIFKRQLQADLALLTAKTKPALIHFLDNSLSLSHMKALIASPPGAPWYAFARVTPPLTNQDFCNSLRQAGCVMLKLGLESGDPLVLKQIGKGITVAAAAKALACLQKAGIAVYVYLIFGTPSENKERARRTLDFAVLHSDKIDFLNIAIFNMPATGEEASSLGTANFYDGDLSLYTDFRHPEGWDRKQVRQFLKLEFKSHPLIAPIIERAPRFFGSLHAPFFALARQGLRE